MIWVHPSEVRAEILLSTLEGNEDEAARAGALLSALPAVLEGRGGRHLVSARRARRGPRCRLGQGTS